MGINIRVKGASAEREVAKVLNIIIEQERSAAGFDAAERGAAQRNQNQSAVGGADLVGVYGLSIEIKRQETLSVNTWWKQCVESARRNEEVPVLLFRQSHKDWRCVMWGDIPLSAASSECSANMRMRCEISWNDFQIWFKEHVRRQLTKL